MGSKIRVLCFDEELDGRLDEFDIVITNRLSLAVKIAGCNPDVILTSGDIQKYLPLIEMPLYIRKKWIHFDELPDDAQLAVHIRYCFGSQYKDDREFNQPLVTIVTPTYNTKDIWRVYRSINWQTYKNIQWLVYDDGSTDEEMKNSLHQIKSTDPRVTVLFNEHCGSIGEVKRRAFSMASGDYLIELDHDDQLLPDAISSVVEAFEKFPDAGFAYSDYAEVMGDDQHNTWYPEGWGMGYGKYYTGEFAARYYNVASAPTINSKTIRHIVGVPNHLRAWRKSFYHEIGGHNGSLFVADDYELLVRTFLNTRMVHISRFGYIQYLHGDNAQNSRRGEIQTLVAYIAEAYESDIHQRLVDLGVDDFIWSDGVLLWDTENPADTPIANYTLD